MDLKNKNMGTDLMKRVVILEENPGEIFDLTKILAECFAKYFQELIAFALNDIPGEDHIFAVDGNNKPMFDLLVSQARKFVFLWYYIHPTPSIKMVNEMKELTLSNELDFAVKYPNVPVKTGFPCIVRYGKHPAGKPDKFIVKFGNPMLEDKIYTETALNTYRMYNWMQTEGALTKILKCSKEMVEECFGKKHKDKIGLIRGYALYAGCAYSCVYPEMGFGMRDIDVNVFFSPKWYTNSRCAFTRHCNILEFGEPEYFGGKTRWLDLMWNTFHIETGDFGADVVRYLNEMRAKSDRWCTMSQRPFIDLTTEQIIYIPNWLKKLEILLK